MGTTTSSLSKDFLDEYEMLTYLSKSEILSLYKTFMSLENSRYQRLSVNGLEQMFPQLKENPFKDRIYEVFSTDNVGFSFEDILDLCSVMSKGCPNKVKAAWAFRIFDFDGDGTIGSDDVKCLISRLIGPNYKINENDKAHIVKVLLDEMDLESSGSVGQLEFQHALGKMPEFSNSFSFRL